MTTLYQCVVCKYVHHDQPDDPEGCEGCKRNPAGTMQLFTPKPAQDFVDFFVVREPGKEPRIGRPMVDRTAESLRQWREGLPAASIDVVTVWAGGGQQVVQSAERYLSEHEESANV